MIRAQAGSLTPATSLSSMRALLGPAGLLVVSGTDGVLRVYR